MTRAGTLSLALTVMAVAALMSPISNADVVIESEAIELLEAGSFQEPSDWTITSKKDFSDENAEYSIGMVADSELSFTHNRPANYATSTSWATNSPTNSNSSIGEPDGYYTWSKGPDITINGYSFQGVNTNLISNVSMVLHISVPDALPSDEIRITIDVNGQEKLVKTIARTFGPLNRMTTPLIVDMDNLYQWTWADLSSSSITVDYVSDGAPDDSEVRVDAVGIRVKYHQPWYSFETVKAIHQISDLSMPVIDINPYEGEIQSLSIESCGLTPNSGTQGTWDFNVEVPYDQELGRIHVFGEGNFTIEAMPQGHTSMENFQIYDNGELLAERDVTNSIRITIYDGCVEMARVDVNDPYLEVTGSIGGSVDGLAESYSHIKFAIGSILVKELDLEVGEFSFQVPIGYALPHSNQQLEIGIATRFQWSSDGTPETTVVHIESMSINGGFSLEWDLDVNCSSPNSITMPEDGGGLLIPMSIRCEDDLTSWEDLIIEVWSEDSNLVDVSTIEGDIRIQPINNAAGSTQIGINVIDESGNVWIGGFNLELTPVEDAPIVNGLPTSTYIELGSSRVIDIEIFDPDSEDLSITTSRSWAIIDEYGDLLLTPVEPGVHTVEISVSDGTNEFIQSIEVVVTAMPDLLIENVEIWRGGSPIDHVTEGEIVQIKIYVRNQGRGIADGIDIRCWLDGILVGSEMIETLAPGGLGVATCNTQIANYGDLVINGVVDGTNSVEESDEDNNEFTMIIESESIQNNNDDDSEDDFGMIIMFSASFILLGALLFFQYGPGRLKKPYDK